MANRRNLALAATTEALRLRQSLGVGLQDALCVYDVVAELGIEVRFVELASLEGMYSRSSPPLIFVSSLRPPGRQVYNCAHELGHDVFDHGSRIDEVGQPHTFDPEEFLADSFAGVFLMPRSAVSHAFAVRCWEVRSPTISQIYTIAGLFGVGYSTLIYHMSRSLNLLSRPYADKLLKHTPKQIRATLLGGECSTGLVVVDTHWRGRPVDVFVGDNILLPPRALLEGDCVSPVRETSAGVIVRGSAPGIGRAYDSETDWAVYLRVSRPAYTGRSVFRHLEDPDYE